jgi:adenine-specific DNA-methyltransferase
MSKQVIWNGDSRELLSRLKPGSVDCIITDPPFGIDNKSNMSVTPNGDAHARKIAGDESPEQALALFREVMDVLLPKTKDDCDMYIFTAHSVFKEWITMSDEIGHGFVRKSIIVWEKDGPGMGDTNAWGVGHELIIFLKKGKKKRNATRRNSVLHVPQVHASKLIHPHEKPRPLLEILIQHSTVPGDFIVDPFGGSGSLARAARATDRSALAIEYDKRNFDSALKAFNGAEPSMFD